MLRLDELKTIPITYDYLNNLYQLYTEDCTSEKFKEHLIPLCNMITKRFIRHYPNMSDEEANLFSECFYRALYSIGRKSVSDFENAKSFYTWMDVTLYRSLQSTFKLDNLVVDADEYDEPEVVADDHDIRNNISFKIKYKDIVRVYNSLLIFYSPDEAGLLKYYLKRFNEDRSNELPDMPFLYIETTFNIKKAKLSYYEKLHFVLFKMSTMFVLNENFNFGSKIIKKEESSLLYDNFFFILAALEKYPYLIELYTVLGSRFLDVVKIFGGCTVTIPTVEEIEFAEKSVSVYVDCMRVENNLDNYKIISEKHNMSVTDIRYNNNLLDTKLKKVLSDSFVK